MMTPAIVATVVASLVAPVAVSFRASDGDQLKTLVATERAFAKTCTERGIRDSFLAFIADDGVMFRPNAVNGRQWFLASPPTDGLLTWYPSVAGISSAGDLGYTAGPWEYREKAGSPPAAHGHFLTVWQKQSDGSWKFVLDHGISHPAPPARIPDWAPAADTRRPMADRVAPEAARRALEDAERSLGSLAVAKGLETALGTNAAPAARFYRHGQLPFEGEGAATRAAATLPGSVTYEPEKADVASSGDLGYTYGRYRNGSGATAQEGVFIRIWTRAPEGAWRVVIDFARQHPPAPPKQP